VLQVAGCQEVGNNVLGSDGVFITGVGVVAYDADCSTVRCPKMLGLTLGTCQYPPDA
jgi:hypothetical protein